jgi:hypothetical protein
MRVGRGFIVTGDACSTQIDVLIYDSRAPILYQEGDLVFVTPDAVRGIVEVKTKLGSGQIPKALKTLADKAALAREGSHHVTPRPVFVGLFAYAVEEHYRIPARVLQNLHNAASGSSSRVIDCLALGPSYFLRFWPITPDNWVGRNRSCLWYMYNVSGMAQGYFVSNVVGSVAPEFVQRNRSVWFPTEGKESYKFGEIGLSNPAVPEWVEAYKSTYSLRRRRPG